jgi:hypothetical protein
MHQNTDLWLACAPMDGPTWGTFATPGAWLCTHLWEHFLINRDLRAGCVFRGGCHESLRPGGFVSFLKLEPGVIDFHALAGATYFIHLASAKRSGTRAGTGNKIARGSGE